jgi:hypothetical protein
MVKIENKGKGKAETVLQNLLAISTRSSCGT